MNKRVKELKAGDIIRLEYGTYDNFVNFTLDDVIHDGDSIKVKCHCGYIEERFTFHADKCVEVIENA